MGIEIICYFIVYHFAKLLPFDVLDYLLLFHSDLQCYLIKKESKQLICIRFIFIFLNRVGFFIENKSMFLFIKKKKNGDRYIEQIHNVLEHPHTLNISYRAHSA